MSPKVVKFVVVPAAAVLGIASFRVHAVGETNVDRVLAPQQLSIYTPLPQTFLYVDEQPGALQSGLGAVRVQLQSYLRTVKGSVLSLKARAVNLYNTGEDVYYYLKDPPSGFLPRVAFITGAGLTGLVLARKGSRLKRVLLPLGLASLGAGICYPAQALALLKVSGRRAVAVSQWSASAVSSLWRAVEPSPTHPTPTPAPPTSSATPPTDSHFSQSSGPELTAPPVAPATLVPDPPTADTAPPGDPSDPQVSGIGLASPISGPEVSEQTVPEEQPQSLLTFAPAESAVPGEAAEAYSSAGKRGFYLNPQLMDFGQSNPEDADLYSTRS
ncbi:hypothetical protein ACEWY4_027276 [Coilia grayii]|uniref:MICOS complex subunit n=1 Tax=Coilia grayii TaxID=363190 RepID=A0ABD1ISI4_9TELE